MAEPSAAQGLTSKELLSKIDKLRELNIGATIPLPQVPLLI